MSVTVDVVGGETHELAVDGGNYADLLARIDLSPHEVSVLVDGRPVPEDQRVDAERVQVVRLVTGG